MHVLVYGTAMQKAGADTECDSRLRRLSPIIREVIVSHMAGSRIADVAVRDEFDRDGNRMIGIVVAVETSDNSKIDSNQHFGLVRQLRERLALENESAYPFIDFVSTEEAYLYRDAGWPFNDRKTTIESSKRRPA